MPATCIFSTNLFLTLFFYYTESSEALSQKCDVMLAFFLIALVKVSCMLEFIGNMELGSSQKIAFGFILLYIIALQSHSKGFFDI